jgi:hypothetical protein
MPTQESSEKVAAIMLQLGNVMQAQLDNFGTSLTQLAATCEEDPEKTALALTAIGIDMQRLAATLRDTLREVATVQQDVPPLPPMLQ